MSQPNVERVIGALVTDEGYRRRFAQDPAGAIRRLMECGVELTEYERHALARLDVAPLERCARGIDARLLKSDLTGGLRCGG